MGKANGGTGEDIAHAVTVDASGNVFTTGFFNGTVDFDPGTGTFNLTSAGFDDIFISKLDSSGNFIWAKQIGNTLNDYSYSIALDSAVNIYTTGYFRGTTDFDPGPGIHNLTVVGGSDIFICKLDSSGNFIWANGFGSTDYDLGYSIALDAGANVYSTGYFLLTADFDPGPGSYNMTSAGMTDVFILKLSDFTTGITGDDNFQDVINIFPNPATHVLNIELNSETQEENKLVLINNLGQVVYSEIFKGIPGKQTETIDVRNWTPGIYFLRITSKDKSCIRAEKISVQ